MMISPFLEDSKGIYNAANCCNIQNHAVLLVGYGEYVRTCVRSHVLRADVLIGAHDK
jgi:C1A family cysteine protease